MGLENSSGMLILSVFKKPTHSDRYLDFPSAHQLYVKFNVVENLFSRIERIVTSEEDRMKEWAVVLDTLKKTTTPVSFIHRVKNRSMRKNTQKKQKTKHG